MKVLYAIQGTGNGHLSRAMEIIPYLEKKCEVDVLISGIQSDLEFQFPVKYRFTGLSFIFGKKGGVDIWGTYKKAKIKSLLHEINAVDVEQYDFVLNDFEPVSAWACKQKGVPCIGLSNQMAVFNKHFPKPKNIDPIGKIVLKRYAPVTSKFGFHFEAFDYNIFTPIIRSEIRAQKCTYEGHYTVYLPSYDDQRILKVLSQIKEIKWQVFSKHNQETIEHENITIQPINNEAFVKSMATSEGILCGAGFATPSEALFMKKKLMVIPMKGQYEQQCNALALKQMGVGVISNLKKNKVDKIRNWIHDTNLVEVAYPNITDEIVDAILNDFKNNPKPKKKKDTTFDLLTAKQFRKSLIP